MAKLSNVRVKRKGQVTIPVELRQRLQIQEGSILEVREEGEGILLKPTAPVRGGNVVGEATYQEIIHDLDRLRKKWR